MAVRGNIAVPPKAIRSIYVRLSEIRESVAQTAFRVVQVFCRAQDNDNAQITGRQYMHNNRPHYAIQPENRYLYSTRFDVVR